MNRLPSLRIQLCRLACTFFVALPNLLSAQAPRQEIALEFPHPGILTITNWNPLFGVPTWIGDIDGDGRDDLILVPGLPYVLGRSDRGEPDAAILLFGSAPLIGLRDFESLRQSRLLYGDFYRGFSPFATDYPFSALGDIDGDGFDDFLAGAPTLDGPAGENLGECLLIYGRAEFPPEAHFEALAKSGIRSTRFSSAEPGLRAGSSSCLVGDMNDDGLLDLAIAARGTAGSEDGAPNSGRVYFVFGRAEGWSEELSLDAVGGEVPGFRLEGAYGSESLGHPVAAAGDLNGDGYADALANARSATRELRREGTVYLVFGGPDVPPRIEAARPGPHAVEIRSNRLDGYLQTQTVVALGDLDEDGFDDVLMASASLDPCIVYLLYGQAEWPERVSIDSPAIRTWTLTSSPPFNSPRIPDLHNAANGLGSPLAALGDTDGDGRMDFLLGAGNEYVDFFQGVGAAYLVYGRRDLPAGAFDSDVGTERLPGLRFLGRPGMNRLPSAIAGGGDFDGDGTKDFLMAENPRRIRGITPEPRAYLVFGGRYLDPPLVVHALRPDSGSIRGGGEIRIIGHGFTGRESVRFGGREALEVSAQSSAELRVVVPPAEAPGRVDLEVEGPAGEKPPERVALANAFTYAPPPPLEPYHFSQDFLDSGEIRVLEIFDLPDRGSTYQPFRLFAGSLDGDAYDDLAITTGNTGPDGSGEVTVLRGGSHFPRRISAADEALDGQLFRIRGPLGHTGFGETFAFPGDFDRDKIPDLLVGGAVELVGFAPGADTPGRSYIISGRREWEEFLSADEEFESGRATILQTQSCGSSLSADAGDLDQDGVPDLLIGGNLCAGRRSRVLWMPGPLPSPGFPIEVDFDAGGAVFGDATLRGCYDDSDQRQAHTFGLGVSGAGDMNGDGWPELAIGSQGFDESVFIILGSPEGLPPADEEVPLAVLTAAGRVVHVRGPICNSDLGASIVPLGDFNGDGLADLLLGARQGGLDVHGEVAIILGSSELGASVREIDLRVENAPLAVRIQGEFAYDYSGSVGALGDLDGDGYDDFGITGVNLRNPSARAYVIFGHAEPHSRLELGGLGARGVSFTGVEGSYFSAPPTGAMAAGDFDGDGHRDLALGLRLDGIDRVVVLFGQGGGGKRALFVRGESNGDGAVGITDAIYSLGYLFRGEKGPACLDTIDVDDSGRLDLSDAVYLLSYLFRGGPAPPPPFPEPGEDPTEDALECVGK